MSRVEILQAIRSCARKLKHNPTRRELRLTARVSEEAIHKHFDSGKTKTFNHRAHEGTQQ